MIMVQIVKNNLVKKFAKERYPNLYQEVWDHDAFSNSSWYDLSKQAHKEWRRFIRSVWYRGKKSMKSKCPFCGKNRDDTYIAEITIIEKIDRFGTYKEFRTGEEKVICPHCGGIKIRLPKKEKQLPCKDKTNNQVMEDILTKIDCLLMDGGLSDEDDDILKTAYDMLERIKT